MLSRGGWTPADYAPHLWREYQELLLGIDRRSRAGAAFDPAALTNEIAQDLTLDEKLFLDAGGASPAVAAAAASAVRTQNVASRLTAARAQFIERTQGDSYFAGGNPLRTAIQFKNDLTLCAVYYVRWNVAAGRSSAGHGPLDLELAKMLPMLAGLIGSLEQAQAASTPAASATVPREIADSVEAIKDSQRVIEQIIDDKIKAWEQHPDSAAIAALLDTPLPTAAARECPERGPRPRNGEVARRLAAEAGCGDGARVMDFQHPAGGRSWKNGLPCLPIRTSTRPASKRPTRAGRILPPRPTTDSGIPTANSARVGRLLSRAAGKHPQGDCLRRFLGRQPLRPLSADGRRPRREIRARGSPRVFLLPHRHAAPVPSPDGSSRAPPPAADADGQYLIKLMIDKQDMPATAGRISFEYQGDIVLATADGKQTISPDEPLSVELSTDHTERLFKARAQVQTGAETTLAITVRCGEKSRQTSVRFALPQQDVVLVRAYRLAGKLDGSTEPGQECENVLQFDRLVPQRLEPFPNRPTTYTFEMVNRWGWARSCSCGPMRCRSGSGTAT